MRTIFGGRCLFSTSNSSTVFLELDMCRVMEKYVQSQKCSNPEEYLHGAEQGLELRKAVKQRKCLGPEKYSYGAERGLELRQAWRLLSELEGLLMDIEANSLSLSDGTKSIITIPGSGS
ncbi:hypothetical protein TorRG33x02_345100 [Trema orientale]|uniref:Uncharacterized protein n=1 Tax=Trema orientale TaxID=63057 RepID=A0A2P5APG4_TREOI|nr:hypothetical protein TorRG33x02_345100 [Trema orientale]